MIREFFLLKMVLLYEFYSHVYLSACLLDWNSIFFLSYPLCNARLIFLMPIDFPSISVLTLCYGDWFLRFMQSRSQELFKGERFKLFFLWNELIDTIIAKNALKKFILFLSFCLQQQFRLILKEKSLKLRNWRWNPKLYLIKSENEVLYLSLPVKLNLDFIQVLSLHLSILYH